MNNQPSPNPEGEEKKVQASPSWTLFLALVIFFATSIYTGYIIFNSNNSISDLKIAIILDCIGFSLFAVLANSWSILEIKHYLKEGFEPKPCKYCSSEGAGPLLCSKCNSIMWGWINSRKAQVAVFVAQHRWAVVTGFLALFLIAPISLLFSLKKEKEKQIEQLMERVEAYIGKQNELRSLIREYESNQDSSGINHKKLNEIIQKYTDLSWEIQTLLQEIELSFGHTITSKMANDDSTPLEIAAFVKDVVIDGDTLVGDSLIGKPSDFRERWGEYLEYTYVVPLLGDRKQALEGRKQAAFNLYTELKVLSIVLREFALNVQTPDSKNDGYKKEISQIFGSKGKFQYERVIIIAKGDYPMSDKDKLLFAYPSGN